MARQDEKPGAPRPDGRAAADETLMAMIRHLPQEAWLPARIAAETCRFWARRFEAHANYWSTLGEDLAAGRLMEHQQHFLERLQRDYAGEGGVFEAALRNQLREAQPAID